MRSASTFIAPVPEPPLPDRSHGRSSRSLTSRWLWSPEIESTFQTPPASAPQEAQALKTRFIQVWGNAPGRDARITTQG
jgi:hypothetical protein